MGIQNVGIRVADYALKNKMGIGSFQLKDGSSIKILQDPDKDIIQFIQVKDGKMLGAKGFLGPNADCQAANLLGDLEKNAENIKEVDKAWNDSCTFDAMA